jgi:hypothetical protein
MPEKTGGACPRQEIIPKYAFEIKGNRETGLPGALQRGFNLWAIGDRGGT